MNWIARLLAGSGEKRNSFQCTSTKYRETIYRNKYAKEAPHRKQFNNSIKSSEKIRLMLNFLCWKLHITWCFGFTNIFFQRNSIIHFPFLKNIYNLHFKLPSESGQSPLVIISVSFHSHRYCHVHFVAGIITFTY